jgi:hypothetical protein
VANAGGSAAAAAAVGEARATDGENATRCEEREALRAPLEEAEAARLGPATVLAQGALALAALPLAAAARAKRRGAEERSIAAPQAEE